MPQYLTKLGGNLWWLFPLGSKTQPASAEAKSSTAAPPPVTGTVASVPNGQTFSS